MSQACQGCVETVLKHWNSLPRAVVESPLEDGVFKESVCSTWGHGLYDLVVSMMVGLLAGFDDLKRPVPTIKIL